MLEVFLNFAALEASFLQPQFLFLKMTESSQSNGRVDLTKPRYNQDTYIGRLKHFMSTTSPLTVLATPKEQEEAKELVEGYIAGKIDEEDEEKLWKAKVLYDATYHPDTGEKLFLPGRMSFQVPGNMVIVGGMLIW